MQIEMENKLVDVLAKLRVQAAARRMPLDLYLEQFIEPDSATAGAAVSLEEFDRILDELAALPPGRGSLPADFSRADIYADHD
ncbi:MAG: hypothetical protein HY289_15915 [Planctomycetes bacterium]|nr:hypothetical protein [Planctomycetota bacterium]